MLSIHKKKYFLLAVDRLFLMWSSCAMLFYLVFSTKVTVFAECPLASYILPCQCSLSDEIIQIWCSHSTLPQIMKGINAMEINVKEQIGELVMENNYLPSLPGRFFGSLQIMRLMLRYNSIERVSGGWLNGLENSLLEVYIVEPHLRSIPAESFHGMVNLIAITIESDNLKHMPDISGLVSLSYVNILCESLVELQPQWFRHLPKLQKLFIQGGSNINRLDKEVFDNLALLESIEIINTGVNWIHLRAFNRLWNLLNLKLSHNQISDVRLIGRIVKDIPNIRKLRLDHNNIDVIADGSFVDLASLTEVDLNGNHIYEIQYGAFLRTPLLKTIYLQDNQIERIHPEAFLQSSGGGVETIFMYNNRIHKIEEIRSLLDSLPALKFLDISNNRIAKIPFGAIHGHATLEKWYMNSNGMYSIDRDALIAMPALLELRLRNNSLSHKLRKPFWNLPSLKGLDLSMNRFEDVDSFLLEGLPSLRRLDLSKNKISKLDSTVFFYNSLLETLNISYNAIEQINASTFRHLEHLFEVDMSFNKLSELEFQLPKTIERLSLRGNRLTTLSSPQSLSLPNLRMLDLSFNLIEHLPEYCFQRVPNLRVLSLANNKIRNLERKQFSGVLGLELLHLQDNEIARIDNGLFDNMPNLLNLNLQGNLLQSISDKLFSKNVRLLHLDISQNNILKISPHAFRNQLALEYLDLSENNMNGTSISFSNLHNLSDIDLSYNRVSKLHRNTTSSWHAVTEIRLSNNMITEIKRNTFSNLTKLQYLDISSNEIFFVESEAFVNLPALQELALADNKILEITDNAFVNLPNLVAVHLQYNRLWRVAKRSFINTPRMVFFNLSHNDFRKMEDIGLGSMQSLEVLDLSANHIHIVSPMPLKNLNWLVELKMDNNEICEIQGSPFEHMPRLRFLTLQNNTLRIINEDIFDAIRGNIAVLDLESNPIECSCRMQWLAIWIQENKYPFPGPKCKNGSLLREFPVEKAFCSHSTENVEYSKREHFFKLNSLRDNFSLLSHEIEDPEQLYLKCEIDNQLWNNRPLGETKNFNGEYVDNFPSEHRSRNSKEHQVVDLIQRQTNIASVESNKNNLIFTSDIVDQRSPPNAADPQRQTVKRIQPISWVQPSRAMRIEPRQSGHNKHQSESRMSKLSRATVSRILFNQSPKKESLTILPPKQKSNLAIEYQNGGVQDFLSAYPYPKLMLGPDNAAELFHKNFREPASPLQGGFTPIVPRNMINENFSVVQHKIPENLISVPALAVIKEKQQLGNTFNLITLPTSSNAQPTAIPQTQSAHKIQATPSFSKSTKKISLTEDLSIKSLSESTIEPTATKNVSTILAQPPSPQKETSKMVMILPSKTDFQLLHPLPQPLSSENELNVQTTLTNFPAQKYLKKVAPSYESFNFPTLLTFEENNYVDSIVSDQGNNKKSDSYSRRILHSNTDDAAHSNTDDAAHQKADINWYYDTFKTKQLEQIEPQTEGFSRQSATRSKEIFQVTQYFCAYSVFCIVLTSLISF